MKKNDFGFFTGGIKPFDNYLDLDIGFGDGHIFDNKNDDFAPFKEAVPDYFSIKPIGKPLANTFAPTFKTTPIVPQPSLLNFVVSSQIVDETGEPVPFASVYEVGDTTNWVESDFNGNFSLQLRKGTQIKIDSVGFSPQTFNAKMLPNRIVLNQGKEGQLDPISITIPNKDNLTKNNLFTVTSNNTPPKNDNWKILIPASLGALAIVGIAYAYSKATTKPKRKTAMAGVQKGRKKTVKVTI